MSELDPIGEERFVEVEESEDEIVLKLQGEVLDIGLVHSFKQQADEKLASAYGPETKKPIVVDCSSIDYIDSSGLGVWLHFHHSAEIAGKEIIFRGIIPKIRRLLEITRLDELLKIEED